MAVASRVASKQARALEDMAESQKRLEHQNRELRAMLDEVLSRLPQPAPSDHGDAVTASKQKPGK